MKITRIEAIPVNVPLKKGLTTKTAHGEHIDSPYVIVKIHTDDGIIGLGEATLSPRWSGETQAGCLAAIDQLIGPVLVGKDPTQVHECRAAMNRVIKLNPFTKCAVEMALWDIAGKAVGKPVHQLLGGKVRSEIPIKLVIGAFDRENVKRLADHFSLLGREVSESENRNHRGRRFVPRRASPRNRRAGHADHDRLQLRLEFVRREIGAGEDGSAERDARRAADSARRSGRARRSPPQHVDPHHGR